jgi:hypothetical protein
MQVAARRRDRTRSTRCLSLAVVLVIVAACTTEQVSEPGPTLTSTTSTTVASAPTTVAETTVPDTTVPATAPATTSETTLPSVAVSAEVPLFVGGAGAGGWLPLGAWDVDDWAETDDDGRSTAGVAPGEPATITNLDGEAGATFGDDAVACFDDTTGPTVTTSAAVESELTSVALPTPSWSLKPRPVAVSASAPAGYVAIAQGAFAGQRVDATLGRVVQIVVVDLDGDGDDEALVVFEYIQSGDGPGSPGDLAAVVLVDATTRQSSVVERQFIPADAEVDDFGIAVRFEVVDVADLNGDGRMEVVIDASYYEGVATTLYTYDGTELTDELSTGCGT